MPTINIKITNIAEIKRAFNKAPALTTRYLNSAIKLSIMKITGTSMAHTPVDTGNLRASHLRGLKFSNLYGEVSPTANYGIYVHQGTKYMKGRPFLYNAVRTENNYVQEQFSKAMQQVLDKIGSEV
jgi:HK97 gp10 family phage protein